MHKRESRNSKSKFLIYKQSQCNEHPKTDDIPQWKDLKAEHKISPRQPDLHISTCAVLYLVLNVCCCHLSSVPSVEDQPNPEVGGGVARAGLSGSHRLFCRPGGKWSFPQVFPFGILPFVFYILHALNELQCFAKLCFNQFISKLLFSA